MTITDEPTRTIEPVGPATAPRRPRWELPGLLTLLAGTAVLYLWALGSLGWANEFYAAAVQSGTKDWTALLFGSLDPGNVITVDKPPAALWAMALSGKIFGFSSWSMLVPQALMGVASVGLLFAAVRRTSGPAAGLLAGAALALTPVAAVMFRFNNPDALLVLLLVVAAYCVVRALDGSPIRWLVFAGTALGFAFLAKLLQAFLIVPVLALVVLVAVPGSMWKRLGALAAGLVAMVISGGWFIALVSLWPADSRPYIGGSTDNSLLELALGYNGLGRVFGGEGNPTRGGDPGGGGPGGGPGGAMFGGDPGITRMFGQSMGTEISWLLPAALIGLLAGLWFTRRAPRTDRARAGLLLWGGWTVVTAVVFSFMKGIMHPYYTIALAPGIAGVVAIATVKLWQGRAHLIARIPLALMLAATGMWNFVLLNRTPDWQPWLRWTVLIGAIIVAAILIVGGHQLGRYTAVLAMAGLLFAGAATAAYTVQTVVHNAAGGPIPISGPPRDTGNGNFGQPGGPFGSVTSSAELEQLLVHADNKWAAATVGSQLAGGLALNTDASVMAIGGFSGGDDAPTLAQFQQYVSDGEVGYFLTSDRGFGGGGGPGGRDSDSASAQITQWVEDNFTSQTIDGTTVYDLTP